MSVEREDHQEESQEAPVRRRSRLFCGSTAVPVAFWVWACIARIEIMFVGSFVDFTRWRSQGGTCST